MIAPRSSEAIPPASSSPWLTIFTSAMKSTSAKIMSAIPAAFASSVPNENSAMTIAITPTMPGKMRPGFESSKIRPYVPIVNRRSAICGSTTKWRNVSNGLIPSSSIGADFVASVTAAPFTWTVRPSICASRSGTSFAMRSMTFSCRASSSRTLTLFRTASSAHCSFRPRAFAILVICATASFSAFRRRSPWMSPPELSTG